MRPNLVIRLVHRWLAWAVGLQVLAWLVGGAVFAWLPFQDWVKAQPLIARPVPEVATPWPASPPAMGPVHGALLVAAAGGPHWKLTLADGRTQRLPADGSPWAAPDAAAVERFARRIYRGEGRLVAVERLAEVPPRLGIVQELAGRREVWRVRFDDALATRLYVDATSGEYITARTEAWVWYDLLWRLHIMDYTGGEDFNNPLLRAAAPLALLFGLSGMALALQTALRRWRDLRRGKAPRA